MLQKSAILKKNSSDLKNYKPKCVLEHYVQLLFFQPLSPLPPFLLVLDSTHHRH